MNKLEQIKKEIILVNSLFEFYRSKFLEVELEFYQNGFKSSERESIHYFYKLYEEKLNELYELKKALAANQPA